MATFEEQIEGLTNLAITSTSNPTQDQLSQFIIDGIVDVTTRCIKLKPLESNLFTRDSGLQTANGLDLNGAKIISVVRADGVTAGNFRPCRRIFVADQYMVTDTTSLKYASNYSPAYMEDENGKISVFPAPSDNAGKDSYKVYYVNNDHSYIDYDCEEISYFPSDKIYLVMTFAAIKAIEAKMAEFAITEEDTELVQGLQVNLGALKKQYDDAYLLMQPKNQGAE
tara:strand:+ start:67 stop:741 length:675 start_codon:yes stop_codon:yes gene_type:complete